jgi:pimeloyl-ACP methyl ester carboxylesterase
MGANVALNFALKYPERCLGLIPVGIGSGSCDAEWWREYWETLADTAEQKGMAAFMDEMKKLPAWGPAFANPDIGDAIVETVLGNSPKGIARTIRGVQRERPGIFQLESALRKLPVKTLVVLSDGDAPVVECSRFMVDRIPDARMVVIKAKSHWTHLESPGEFLRVVDDFVRGLGDKR